MREVTTTVYQFNELSDDAKQKAIEKFYDINVDCSWWDSVYDDANTVGLKITSFDIDRASYVKATFTDDACFTAHKILENHGEMCETYKTAQAFLAERDEAVNTAPKDENGDFEDEYELDQKLDDIENDFLSNICEDYRIILTKEYEYLTSEDAIIETITINEYDFGINGEFPVYAS